MRPAFRRPKRQVSQRLARLAGALTSLLAVVVGLAGAAPAQAATLQLSAKLFAPVASGAVGIVAGATITVTGHAAPGTLLELFVHNQAYGTHYCPSSAQIEDAQVSEQVRRFGGDHTAAEPFAFRVEGAFSYPDTFEVSSPYLGTYWACAYFVDAQPQAPSRTTTLARASVRMTLTATVATTTTRPSPPARGAPVEFISWAVEYGPRSAGPNGRLHYERLKPGVTLSRCSSLGIYWVAAYVKENSFETVDVVWDLAGHMTKPVQEQLYTRGTVSSFSQVSNAIGGLADGRYAVIVYEGGHLLASSWLKLATQASC